jgi:hypothetical protein
VAESLGVAVLELVADTKPLVAGLEKGKAASEEMARRPPAASRTASQKAAIPAAAGGRRPRRRPAQERRRRRGEPGRPGEAGPGLQDGRPRTSTTTRTDRRDRAVVGAARLQERGRQGVAGVSWSRRRATPSRRSGLLSNAQDLARYKGISLTDASKMLTMTMRAALAPPASSASRSSRSRPPPTRSSPRPTTPPSRPTSTPSPSPHGRQAGDGGEDGRPAQRQARRAGRRLLQDGAGRQGEDGRRVPAARDQHRQRADPGPDPGQRSSWPASRSSWSSTRRHRQDRARGHRPARTAILLLAAYTKIAAAAQAIWNMALDANPIGLIIIAIAALVVAFVELWKHSQTFRDIVLGVWHDVSAATTASSRSSRRRCRAPSRRSRTGSRSHWPEIATLLSGPFAPLVALATDGFGVRDKLIDAFKAVLGWFSDKLAGQGPRHRAVHQAWDRADQRVRHPGRDHERLRTSGLVRRQGLGDQESRQRSPFTDASTSSRTSPARSATPSMEARQVFAGAGEAIGRGLGNPIIGRSTGSSAGSTHRSTSASRAGCRASGARASGSTSFHIPYLAAGGIVTSPTLAMIGEAGPEAVIPLSAAGGPSAAASRQRQRRGRQRARRRGQDRARAPAAQEPRPVLRSRVSLPDVHLRGRLRRDAAAGLADRSPTWRPTWRRWPSPAGGSPTTTRRRRDMPGHAGRRRRASTTRTTRPARTTRTSSRCGPSGSWPRSTASPTPCSTAGSTSRTAGCGSRTEAASRRPRPVQRRLRDPEQRPRVHPAR